MYVDERLGDGDLTSDGDTVARTHKTFNFGWDPDEAVVVVGVDTKQVNPELVQFSRYRFSKVSDTFEPAVPIKPGETVVGAGKSVV